jgi:hypothetical protein
MLRGVDTFWPLVGSTVLDTRFAGPPLTSDFISREGGIWVQPFVNT